MTLIHVTVDHHPLSMMYCYFEDVDLEAIFIMCVAPAKIKVDHFGSFLDFMQNTGCSSILSDIAVKTFNRN